MKWAVVFAIAAVILSACQRPMTWNEMHGRKPHDEYRALHPLPFSVPVHIQPLVKTRDC
jgi:hypothetical protein